jgi:nucleoside-diphosphate-sugar epimerase
VRGGTPRVIYISSTGVYGNASGNWIDENTPTDPQREGGQASLAAEQTLSAHPLGKNSVILRLAGLYGPGRIPFLDLLRAGQPIPAPEHGHLNLIHVDDAAASVVAASELPPFTDGPRIYCISDGHPAQRSEYYREVARQIGAPPPMFTSPDPNSPRARRAESDRRVRNDRMLADLKVKLQFPNYRAGLAAILSNA